MLKKVFVVLALLILAGTGCNTLPSTGSTDIEQEMIVLLQEKVMDLEARLSIAETKECSTSTEKVITQVKAPVIQKDNSLLIEQCKAEASKISHLKAQNLFSVEDVTKLLNDSCSDPSSDPDCADTVASYVENNIKKAETTYYNQSYSDCLKK